MLCLQKGRPRYYWQNQICHWKKVKTWKSCLWYQKKTIPQLCIFCLIQGINKYVQIDTYWRYIVQIMASNILLLASKNVFSTSQWMLVLIVEPWESQYRLSIKMEETCFYSLIITVKPVYTKPPWDQLLCSVYTGWIYQDFLHWDFI